MLQTYKNLVISGCVRGMKLLFFFNKRFKNGITEPREFITFPYLTTENIVSLCTDIKLDEIVNLSAASFVAPYKFIGSTALSVDKVITFLTLLSIKLLLHFVFPKYLF